MSLKNGTYYVSHMHKKIIKIRQIKVILTVIFKLKKLKSFEILGESSKTCINTFERLDPQITI